MSNFWISLGLSLIVWEIELDLRWFMYCIISKISRTAAVTANLSAQAGPETAQMDFK